jgi:hypothetical protein
MEVGDSCVEINWVANPFRGDKFEEAWAPVAAAALDFGATGYIFFRSKDDPLQFTQLAFFDSKLEFERYWYSEELAEARAEASGLYQVPILPIWHKTIGAGSLSADAVET